MKKGWKKQIAWVIPLLLSLVLSHCGKPFFVSKEDLARFADRFPTYEREYLYSLYGNNIRGFSIDTETGAITEFSDTPFGPICSPKVMVSDPSYRFLYVAGGIITSEFFGYSIDDAGQIAPVPGSPYTAGSNPSYMAITPDSRFAYVTNAGAGDEVHGYSIDGGSGALSLLGDFPFGVGCTPRSNLIDRDGEYLYVADNLGDIYYYSINQSTGAITELTGLGSPLNTDVARYLKQQPFERNLYLLRSQSTAQNIRGFEIAGDGKPTELPTSPWGLGPANTAYDMDFHPSGDYLYVTSGITGLGLHALEVDSGSGNLSPIEALGADNGPRPIAAELNGNFLYVGADDFLANGIIHIFRISDDGSLSEVSESPYYHGSYIQDLIVVGKD